MPGHPLDRRVIEEVRVVLQLADELPVRIGHLHHQVQGRTALSDVDCHQVKRSLTRGRARTALAVVETARLFPGERDLEQRCMA